MAAEASASSASSVDSRRPVDSPSLFCPSRSDPHHVCCGVFVLQTTGAEIPCATGSELLVQMGWLLPSSLCPYTAQVSQYGADVDADDYSDARAGTVARGGSCWEQIELKPQAPEWAQLILAQMQPNEYLVCYKELTTDRSAFLEELPMDDDHHAGCTLPLQQRKAQIAASGLQAQSVDLQTLYRRAVDSMRAGCLPRLMSACPSDWAPLLRWRKDLVLTLMERRRSYWRASDECTEHDDEPVDEEPWIRTLLMRETVALQRATRTITEVTLWELNTEAEVARTPGSLLAVEPHDDNGPAETTAAAATDAAATIKKRDATAAATASKRAKAAHTAADTAAEAASRQ